uniref:Uncharacterized protein n=1 Tax=Acrobeloides nanus TaxID=290746 RepID=A0A914EA51_9BILA
MTNREDESSIFEATKIIDFEDGFVQFFTLGGNRRNFLKLCAECELKKEKPKKGIVVKPTVAEEQNERCQVDLIDLYLCPDDDYKHIMVHQDRLTDSENSGSANRS